MIEMGPGESLGLCAKTQKMWDRGTESGRSCEAPGLAEMCRVRLALAVHLHPAISQAPSHLE